MKNRKLTALLLGMTLAVSACSTVSAETYDVSSDTAETMTDMFTDKDPDASWDETAVKITLEEESASAEGAGVQIDGTAVTITEGGTYVVSGVLTDGQIIVNAGNTEEVKLVLNGVSIKNESGACIFVKTADKVILTLAEGSENILEDTGNACVQTDEGSAVNGAIFSIEDLCINGTGSLAVSALYSNGIVCKNDFAIADGVLTISAAGPDETEWAAGPDEEDWVAAWEEYLDEQDAGASHAVAPYQAEEDIYDEYLQEYADACAGYEADPEKGFLTTG